MTAANPAKNTNSAAASLTAAHTEIVSHHDKVLIVDFGSQVTQLIARRVREAGVYCEIAPFQNAEKAFAELGPKAVILSGGPASVTKEGSPRAPQAIFRRRLAGPFHLLRPADDRRAAWRRRSKVAMRQNSAAPMSKCWKIPPCSRAYGRRARNTRSG